MSVSAAAAADRNKPGSESHAPSPLPVATGAEARFSRIVVPLDGSALAERAVPFALRIPAEAVRLVRVEPASPALGPGPELDFGPDWQATRMADVRVELEIIGDRFRERGVAVDVAVVFENDAAAAILAAASDADLIVMTTRGRGAAGRALLGSVADRVVRQTSPPTLLVRARRRAVAPAEPTRIVVPLDGSIEAERALRIAAKLARALRLPLQLVRVVDVDREEIRLGEARPERWEQEAAEYLTAQAQRLAADGLAVDHQVRLGKVHAALFAAIDPGDIVVLTSHGRGGALRRLLGSAAEFLVRRVAGPVLLVPSAGRGTTGGAPGARPEAAAV